MAHTLTVAERQAGGKGTVRRVRMKGLIPGVIYGQGKENSNFSVDSLAFSKFLAKLRSEAELISVQMGEGQPKLVLIKEFQYHPVSEQILHIDFYEVDPSKKLHVTVPLQFVGTPTGVVDQGGMVEYLAREVDIFCFPKDIPARIDVDVKGLQLGQALHVSDLKLPEGASTREDVKKVLVHVTGGKKEEVPAETAAAPAKAKA